MSIYNDLFWTWVEQHRDKDTTRLRLGKKNNDPEWIDDAITQIENERRSIIKFRHDKTWLIPRLMPLGISVEQATSARVAELHYKISGINANRQTRVLDMTCGLGVDASFLACDTTTHLTALDLNSKIAEIATYNFMKRPNIEVINGDSVEWLKSTDERFDLIFIDPARRNDSGGRVYNLHDCIPDVTSLLPLMLAKSPLVMVKMSPMLDLTQTLRDLPGTRELWVVAERGECRELLAVIDGDNTPEPKITIWNDGATFSFTMSEEATAQGKCAIPSAGAYLLEPSPATMKAAPFKLLCQRFNTSMIHPNTHLYTSTEQPHDFPGRIYKINDIIPYTSGNIRHIARKKLEADVATRNFMIGADALRARLGIKKNGDTRITGITAMDGKPYLIFAEKIEP